MNTDRLRRLLDRFPDLSLLVVGDFFLDKYLDLDRRLSEPSLETGLEAYQVVDVRCYPGAAGTVVNNLRALGARVLALGVIGEDGEGYDLLRALHAQGVETQDLVRVPGRFTPTYLKPMLREKGAPPHELNRFDQLNRTPLPAQVEAHLIARLRARLPEVHGVIIADQVSQRDCGVITDRVRAELARLAGAHPGLVFLADSRERIGEFQAVIVKPNAQEAARATGEPALEAAGWALRRRTGRPVVVTAGAQGVWVFDGQTPERVPAVPVDGPIDVVGAGDSAMAGLAAALCAGGTLSEAAWVANLAASITIQQLGVTGTATRAQVLARQSALRSETASTAQSGG